LFGTGGVGGAGEAALGRREHRIRVNRWIGGDGRRLDPVATGASAGPAKGGGGGAGGAGGRGASPDLYSGGGGHGGATAGAAHGNGGRRRQPVGPTGVLGGPGGVSRKPAASVKRRRGHGGSGGQRGHVVQARVDPRDRREAAITAGGEGGAGGRERACCSP